MGAKSGFLHLSGVNKGCWESNLAHVLTAVSLNAQHVCIPVQYTCAGMHIFCACEWILLFAKLWVVILCLFLYFRTILGMVGGLKLFFSNFVYCILLSIKRGWWWQISVDF